MTERMDFQFQGLSPTTSFETVEYNEHQDEFGWYSDEDYESMDETSPKVCKAWLNAVTEISTDPKHVKCVEPADIIFVWNNPNPSLSVKSSSSDVTKQSMTNISCCVGGLRLCQYPCGEIRIEFNFICCYGSRSYNSWKSFHEFNKLSDILTAMQKKVQTHSFPDSLSAWKNVLSRKKWFRCYEIRYLIQQSILLGRFMEALLHEASSPGLLLAFVQSPQLSSLPLW